MLIVGLGNPGGKYSKTYHNLGFMVVEALAKKLGVKIKNKECRSLTGVYYDSEEKVVLAEPQTMMNLSGEAVYELFGRYDQNPSDLVVVCDDFDLPVGHIRVRKEGSAGSHNGLKNIILNVESKEFIRFRVGISGKGGDPMNLVLDKIGKDDKKPLEDAIERAAEAIKEYVEGTPIDKVMLKYSK